MLFATLLIARVEEAPPPLIDLDATVLLQFGLFVFMYILLRYVLFAPYLRMRAARDRGIAGARTEAHEMEEKARAIVTDYDAKLGRAKQRGADERARVRSEAAARERSILGVARDEVGKALDEARAKIAGDATTARAQLEAQSLALARTMAKKILGREVA
jgi:F0F1-type ATP synthase membrane subunit b/b'